MRDEEEVAPPARKPKPRVTYRFSCGDAPCRVTRIIDGVSRRLEHAELPAPAEDPKR